MKIVINPFDAASIEEAVERVKRYEKWVKEKETLLRQRLAMIGASVASIEFSRAIYNGTNDVSVRVSDDGKTATIYAEGAALLFIEFGSGSKHGYGHPEAEEFGYGPGTYSDGSEGKGHWDDPNGWWYGKNQHSFGNPPAMAMFRAREAIVEEYTRIAREVFRSD